MRFGVHVTTHAAYMPETLLPTSLSFKTMFLHSYFFVYVLALGLTVGTDAFLCPADTYKQDVTYTSVTSVTSLVHSFLPFDGGNKDVTFTKTSIVWATTTTTLHHQHYPPPVVRTSTTHLVSTAHVTITHTIQVPSTSTLTTTLHLTTLEVTTMTVTHSSSLPAAPRHTHTATATFLTTAHASPKQPPPMPTLTSYTRVTSYLTVTPGPPQTHLVTTTEFSTVTFCDEPQTTIVS